MVIQSEPKEATTAKAGDDLDDTSSPQRGNPVVYVTFMHSIGDIWVFSNQGYLEIMALVQDQAGQSSQSGIQENSDLVM